VTTIGAPRSRDRIPGMTRRGALRRLAGHSAAAAVFPTIVPSRALGLDGAVPPSERITLGVIGIGPRCTYVLTPVLTFSDVHCLAIADVQSTRRASGKALVDGQAGGGDCAVYRDFRQLLDRPDLDAVLIATGDRWHASAAILAAEAGKDVYCEKPCGITMRDCQEVAETFRRTERIFQAGTQRRSVPLVQYAVRLAREGALGTLHTLRASVYEPRLENAWLAAEPTPPPETCDWNLWLGPAPWRPYNAQYVAGKWRGQFDFDSGAKLLDWGAHTLDLCQWANDADGTTPVEFVPSADNITCRYANGVQVVLDFLPRPFGNRGPRWNTELGTCPVKFIGTEGWVSTGDEGAIDAGPESLAASIPEAVKRVRGLDAAAHARDFFSCVKSRRPTACNADIMRTSHVAAHAAAVAWIIGRPLTFDPATETFTTPSGPDHEANRFRVRPERDPWT